jgi:inner membrane protein
LRRTNSPLCCAGVDPLTHILLGASLGYVTFGNRLGRTAALAGGLAAFAPDADVFIRSATDPLLAIEHHRGFTHSLIFTPIGSVIAAACWLARPAWRGRRWITLWSCCLAGYLSHVLLDAATTYGTQLLWPFSRHRAGWDIISIIDPVFTLVLLAGLVGSMLRKKRAAATGSVVFCAMYVGFGALQHHRATQAQEALASARGHQIVRSEVMPTLGNNMVWRALYEYDDRVFSDRIRVGWFSAASVREGWSLPLADARDLSSAESARNQHQSFERFAWFSDHWVSRSPANPSVLADMRYSLSTEAFDPIWGIRFTPSGTPPEVNWINRTRDRQIKPGELWKEIIGRDPRFRSLKTGLSR